MSIEFSAALPSRISAAIMSGILGVILGPIFFNPITILILGFANPTTPILNKLLFAVPRFFLGVFIFIFSPIFGIYYSATTGATCGLLAMLKYNFVYGPQSIFYLNIAERSAFEAIKNMSEQSLQENAVKAWNNYMHAYDCISEFNEKLSTLLNKNLSLTEAEAENLRNEIDACLVKYNNYTELSDKAFEALRSNPAKDYDVGYAAFNSVIMKVQTEESPSPSERFESLYNTFKERYPQNEPKVAHLTPTALPTTEGSQDSLWTTPPASTEDKTSTLPPPSHHTSYTN
jgi:hypothetical protein